MISCPNKATLFSDANGIQATPTSAVDYSEKVSIGGESIASSEYESVSLIEETGLCGCVRGVWVWHVCMCGCVRGVWHVCMCGCEGCIVCGCV